jgi:hypothetical protein
VPTLAMPSTTSTPTTMGSRLLNTHVGRICGGGGGGGGACVCVCVCVCARVLLVCVCVCVWLCVGGECETAVETHVAARVCCAQQHHRQHGTTQHPPPPPHLQYAGKDCVQARLLLLPALDLLHVGCELWWWWWWWWWWWCVCGCCWCWWWWCVCACMCVSCAVLSRVLQATRSSEDAGSVRMLCIARVPPHTTPRITRPSHTWSNRW